ncbi:MAG: glycosyltransferase family 2 protein [Cytophagales bacterium]|nr:glycosyltransferase family 2 protein [Cytophagales bacterium]MDW8384059.1 glycosyltransferase family 2 protein [Flammeovirgaceae bacterium]
MKIAAVIVTFNRLPLLQECIESLLNNTRKPDTIYVVNNGSTDGQTPQWLDTQPYLKVIHQENVGSAGGFYTGIKRAYEDGYDWVWLMDDDGKPAPDALEKLLNAALQIPDGKVFNSIVINKNDAKKDEIVFGYNVGMNVNDMSNVMTYHSLKELLATGNKIFDGGAQFFNASLIHRVVIEKVGLPDARLFIRGDEVEYLFRIQKAGFKTYTVAESIIFHPKPASVYVMLGKLKLFYYEPMNSFKLYYHIRNLIYLNRKYSISNNLIKIAAFYLKEFLFWKQNNFSIKKMSENFATIQKAIRDGYALPIQ